MSLCDEFLQTPLWASIDCRKIKPFAAAKGAFCRTKPLTGGVSPILATPREGAMLILVTGATGKVGRNLIARLLEDPRFSGARIRALCHNRTFDKHDCVEMTRGSIADRAIVSEALAGVTHVIHLATCKETPADVMDVTVKGLFWLLEGFRLSPTARQFILIGGDAGIGHFHYRHDGPITEDAPHMAYPGCYALSKVLEEVMLDQFGIQYGTNGCCLRAP